MKWVWASLGNLYAIKKSERKGLALNWLLIVQVGVHHYIGHRPENAEFNYFGSLFWVLGSFPMRLLGICRQKVWLLIKGLVLRTGFVSDQRKIGASLNFVMWKGISFAFGMVSLVDILTSLLGSSVNMAM